MRIWITKSRLMLPEFTEVNLEPGTYQATMHPVLNVVWTRQRLTRWLTFYIGPIALQFAWNKKCKCLMCRKNRLRALFFLKPWTVEEWNKRMEGGK